MLSRSDLGDLPAMIAAYREPDRTRGRHLMRRLIDSISHNVPAALSGRGGHVLLDPAADLVDGGGAECGGAEFRSPSLAGAAAR